MEQNKKSYWKGLEQLRNDPDFVEHANKEFPRKLNIKDTFGDNTQEGEQTGRRDFLKLMGFSMAAVSLAACEAPVKKAIPYLNKPEEVDPGVANYYASTYAQGGEYCSILVKTREGRPIFVEGNTYSSISKGGTNPRVNASVLSLYDSEKSKGPSIKAKSSDWETVDKEIMQTLSQVAASGKPIKIVSNTIMSPTTKRLIADFTERFPSTELVTYDPISLSGNAEAHAKMFGKPFVPSYAFDKADVVVGIDADFLGSWYGGVEHSVDYAQKRKVKADVDVPEMSMHFQFESMLTITGASADYRSVIKPSQSGLVAAQLYNAVARATGNPVASGIEEVQVPHLEAAAQQLLANRGKSIVISGINDEAVQLLVASINQMLGNYGQTLDIEMPSFQKQGNDGVMAQFVQDMEAGNVGAVIFYNCNPVYDHPAGSTIASAIANTSLSIATSDRLDETASACVYHCPDAHYLESWNDAEPKKGHFSICQPTIKNIFDTRQVQISLMKWMGNEDTDFHAYLRKNWQESIFPMSGMASFEKFWQQTVHDGIYEMADMAGYTSVHEPASTEGEEVSYGMDMAATVSGIKSKYASTNSGLELLIYPSGIMGDGSQSNNPILQETPDPITKVCWGNYVAVSPSLANEMGLTYKFETKVPVVNVKAAGKVAKLPLVVQPGLQKNTIAIATGYGRDTEKSGKVSAMAAGYNAFQMVNASDGLTYAVTTGVTLEPTGEVEDVAQTQTAQTIMGRETIIQETTLAEYVKDRSAGRYRPKISTYTSKEQPDDISMWDIDKDGEFTKEEFDSDNAKLWNEYVGSKAEVHKYPIHHWGMAIDLNSCTGCSACIVACHTENNVPVVGKQEVINRREMHWLRIDRYYSSKANPESLEELEQASENPEVVFQPMMCQHCNNAPCETVCPVVATTHSSEGLNQMTYNRCVGTKYCANNCPYKVRRFNWFRYHNNDDFDFHMNNDLGKMVLNPDVTVRSRGVMEKCSLCVQRIQSGKLKAKREKRKMQDSDAITACASACPTNAITFGDLNNTESNVRNTMEEYYTNRAYNVLDEIRVKPNVWYLTKVRNKNADQA